MILQDIIGKTDQHFKKLGIENSKLEAEFLLAAALGMRRLDLFLKLEYFLNQDEIARCREWVVRRAKGEPLAYIQGHKEFYALEFIVNSNVLIPRPETEHLVDEIVDYAKASDLQEAKILDLGSGSGCLGIAAAHKIKAAFLYACDISEAAIEVAKQNAEKHIPQKYKFYCQDAAQLKIEEMSMGLDIVVANPPYIASSDPAVEKSVHQFEPNLALYAENNGYECIEKWLPTAIYHLKTGGLCLFEIGYQQGAKAKEIFEQSNGFAKIKIGKDYSSHDRYILAIKK